MTISSIIFLLILQLWIRPSTSDPRKELITRSCREARPQNLTAFVKNFVASMDSIDQLIALTGFGVAHSGEPPDGTYIMAQCFCDLLPDDCSACHAAIGKHLHGCFPAIGGRVYLEGCFIRAENYSFFHEISTKEDKRVGTLADGREIAIKRIFVNATSRGSQVYEEVNMISRAQHKKLGSVTRL